jgi:hypothetical protein
MRQIASVPGSLLAFALLVAGLSVIAGCASAKVSTETKSSAADRAAAPPVVYVHDFDLGAATVKSDPGTLTGRPRLLRLTQPDPAAELERLSDLLARTIVDDLQKADVPARRLAADAPRPASGWLVSGAFGEVTEGNRMQKAVLGFGAGDSDAHLYVTVRDLARPPGEQDLLDFAAESSGNKAPGGGVGTVITHTPYGMAAEFVLARDASEKDVTRTGHLIAEKLVKLVRSARPR